MKKIAMWSLMCLVFFACRKDSDSELVTVEDYIPPAIEINVNASLTGIVSDDFGEPVVDALVILAGLTTFTDERGLFVFNNVRMDQRGTYVQVEKTGFFNGSTRFFPNAGSKNHAKIRLLEKRIIGTLDGTAGGVLSSSEGISLNFPANSVVDASGQIYQGQFNVAARWINPAHRSLLEIMPGNLQGINNAGDEMALISYGMMAVELTSSTGEVLNLGNDKKATLFFPLKGDHFENAPDEIPLWYFDESTGLWKEEGKAILDGDLYIGEVSHFSFWNCDAPFPLIRLSGRLVSSYKGGQVPVANAKVKILAGALGCGYGTTNSDGFFVGKVPAGELLKITISDPNDCNAVYYTKNIGPFQVDTSLGDLEAESTSQLVKIKGSLIDCNDAPIVGGWVYARFGENSIYYYVENENFEFFLFNCQNFNDLNIKGIDYDNLEEGDLLTFATADEINVGPVKACGQELINYFRATVDGEEQVFFDMIVEKHSNSQMYFKNDAQEFTLTLYNHGGVGTYDTGNVLTFSFGKEYSFAGGRISTGCSGMTIDCVSMTEFNITEYNGTIGEQVKGDFTGTIDVSDQIGTMYNDLPFSGVFSVELKPF